jgi:hypothetical protein
MALFSRFSRKVDPLPPTLEQRIAALDSASPEIIAASAVGNEEEALRIAAIYKLPPGDALRGLAGLADPKGDDGTNAMSASLQRAAHTRFAQLIDEGMIDVSTICADQTQAARLVVESPCSRLRQLAAQTIREPEKLKHLLKEVRNKDKNVYKILKQTSDTRNAEERRLQQALQEASAACAALERHSHRTYDGLYASTFATLETQWRLIASPAASNIAQRAQQAIDRCKERIAEHHRNLEQQAAARAAQQAEQQSARDALERERLAAEQQAQEQAAAESAIKMQASTVRDAEEQARAQRRAAEEEAFLKIGGLIRMALAAIRDGATQRAAGLRRSIEEKLPSAPALPISLTRQLQQLDEKLSELRQWKDYAVAPKRLELIEEMERLIGSTDAPTILAERIKSVQEEWRTISQGIAIDTADKERFQRASQAAYQPCRDYFEAQAQLRRQNLQNRKLVLERLAAFEAAQNAENPDWRLVASVLREAPQEWRQNFPVDREANNAIQVEFDASIERLKAKLGAWHESNLGHKQTLIKRARHLLTLEDGRQAIDAVKSLQLQWKDAAPAARDQEQILWSEFREVCDAVYKKRQQAYTEYTAGLEANKLKAVALCEEAERVAALSGSELIEAAASISTWHAAFEALEEMPRAEARGLQTRFERAIDLCRARLDQQLARAAEQSFINLFETGRLVQSYAWAVAQGADAEHREALRQAADVELAGIRQWPKGGLKALKEALARADTDKSAASEHERACRRLCIRCEIQTETATPPEDEALRREYQVQRLMQAVGQGGDADDGDWDSIALEWIEMGAIAPQTYQALHERFMQCWTKRPIRAAQQTTFASDRSHERRNDRESRFDQNPRRDRSASRSAKIRQ